MPEKRNLSEQLDSLLQVPTQPAPLRRLEFDHATGEGILTTPPEPADKEPDFAEHLRELGYSPDEYAIDQGGVRVSLWESPTKDGVQVLRAIRARVVKKHAGLGFDADALIAEIKRHKPPKTKPQPVEQGGCLVVCVADTQIGKPDSPDGSGAAYTVNEFLRIIGAVEARTKELRRIGRPINSLLVACLGDLVEGCDGSFYPNQTFTVELDRREQTRVMRRLLLKAMERWARLFPEVTLAAVAGNHGENRAGRSSNKGGISNPADSDDLAVPEQVLEILAANPDTYGHVRGAIGGDPYTRVVEAGGHVVGMLHGHMARESGQAAAKIARWYEQQSAGRQPIAAADVVISGHYHHLFINESNGAVTFIQCPSLEGGSYYTAVKGAAHNPGLATFCLYPNQKRISDLAIL